MTWLTGQLATYIGANAARVAAAIEPAAVALATLYVMVWGYLHLRGAIAEPFAEGIRRILVLALVLAVSLGLWQYHAVIVDSVFVAPTALAAAILGVANPLATVDTIWERGGTVAGLLWDQGGLFGGDVGYYLAGAFVWLIVGGICVYATFLLALSRIALAVLLALGPLFIVLTLFPATRRYFEAWVGLLSNYALIGVLTVLIAALLLQVVESYAGQTAARGSAIVTVDALNLLLVTGLVLLLMRQVLPIAAGLGAGIALSTQQVFSGMADGALGGGKRVTAQLLRGFLDHESLRRDPLARQLGYAMRRQVLPRLATPVWRGAR